MQSRSETAPIAAHGPADAHGGKSSIFTLFFGAIGVVFGDIGTSPLYTMKETFAGPHPLALDRLHVYGVLSLIFWAVMCVVSIKYVIIIMRADNRGEGGSLALLALLRRTAEGRLGIVRLVSVLGVFAAALFYGDSMITPAISVLSAVEGLEVAAPQLHYAVVPLTIAILVGLFLVQRHGSASIGVLFGPVMTLWFGMLAFLGVMNIGQAPDVLWALSPHYALAFIMQDGVIAFLALGSVVLAVTGAEALYTDMGHFGRLPIRLAWYLLVLPALMLNYFGQGALLLKHPESIENPFFHLAPAWAGVPMVILATVASVIASQAVISGAFSVTRQAIQLGYLPRMNIVHTSEREIGQIYIPALNWTLAVFVIALVLGFQTSSSLASAYGIAVTGTMIIDTVLIAMVMLLLWKWAAKPTILLIAFFLFIDLSFFLANSTKILHGGWFPLAVGIAIFILLTTWNYGRALLKAGLERDAIPVEDFFANVSTRITRVPGTAVFLASVSGGVPLSLLHNLKHNHVLHERVVLLSVIVDEVPFVPADRCVESQEIGGNCFRVNLHYGYMQATNIPKTLANARYDQLGFFYEPMRISYFLSRKTVIPSSKPGMSLWREKLFAWMVRSSATPMEFFCLPVNRVVELGGQVEI
ncbi:potassium transporter Kup [Skermanella stibiiresistens SB22]|uniref:Probable potassium transport system protein Kup n=1 Tax=Skermanella stibiiresistens SB22 TaxID=1385369 RepID=W9GUU5_9PROT|nr:potassium transporter Kup [Skermanella stibiiresistens]EWY37645.1 potassium transporter Kup [Skermanella stibiiresistens SB22]